MTIKLDSNLYVRPEYIFLIFYTVHVCILYPGFYIISLRWDGAGSSYSPHNILYLGFWFRKVGTAFVTVCYVLLYIR